MMKGVLVRGVGGVYYVLADDGVEYVLRARGKLRREKVTPVTGDIVTITPGEGEQHGWLEGVEPRRSWFVRPPVANIDTLFIVLADSPAPDLLLADRLIIYARQNNVEPVLCVNKLDIGVETFERVTSEYARSNVRVVGVSAYDEGSLDMLKEIMRGRMSCFTGQSGVGKSTLLARILGRELETGDISRRIERGRNTTRHAELLIHDDIRVLDTAGFSLLSLELAPPLELQTYYPEFEGFIGLCRFNPCIHDKEPDCAVRAMMIELGLGARYARYIALLDEARTQWKNRY